MRLVIHAKLLRFYALVAVALVLVHLPGFLIDFENTRVFPLEVGYHPAADGTLGVRGGTGQALPGNPRLAAVSLEGGPFLSASSAEIARRMRDLPVGARVAYRLRDRTGATTDVGGTVTRAPVDRETAITRAVAVIICLGFVFAAGALALGGVDLRSMLAAAGLAGLAVLFGSDLSEASAAVVRSLRLDGVLHWAWASFPAWLGPGFLVAFLARFPTDLSRRRPVVALEVALTSVGVALSILIAAIATPGALEGLSGTAQTTAVLLSVRLQLVLYALIACAVASVLFLQVFHARRAFVPQGERARGRFVGRVLVASIVPTLVLVLAQATSLIVRNRLLVSPLVMQLGFLPLLLVPAALVYASLAPEVQSLGLLLRRAVLFAFSSATLAILSFVPLAGLLIYAWSNREVSLAALVARHPVTLAVAFGIALAGVLSRERLQRALERLFLREREDARKTLRALAERTRAVGSTVELAELLAREIDAALHADSVALFVRGEGDHFRSAGRELPPLPADSFIASKVREKRILDLDPDTKGSALRSLPELERHWVAETHAHLVLGLPAADGSVLGLLVVGEKLSELPYDRDDLLLLAAVAASGALALENSLLRSSAGGARAAAFSAPPGPDAARALGCPLCGRLFSPALERLCPEHERALEPVDVPHLLAGKFRLERRIGAGGMGVVYLARDLSLSRAVAIKTLPRLSPESAIRLRREARAMARLLHPNLAVIFSVESWRQTPFLVVEYLDGGTLAQRIAKGPVATSDVLRCGVQLAAALETVHARGVLHRDVKPSNVGFAADGTSKLLDFGLASILEEFDVVPAPGVSPASGDDTAAIRDASENSRGHVVGTAAYLSPEAIRGQAPQAGFDLWGLAVTLWEALAGRNPFLSDSTHGTLARILAESAPDVRERRPECPPPLAEFLKSALARNVNERPKTAREWRRALELAAATPGNPDQRPMA